MNTQTINGTALVTGASSGIGEVFARRLAARGYDLVLVARREDRLQALASELHDQLRVKASVLAADLGQMDGIRRVEECIVSLPELELLVNNAGFGVIGAFSDVEEEKSVAMLMVHDMATVRLTRAALPGMIARHHGGVINVSSTAAFLPLGGNVMYTSTKAFLNAFTQALAFELRGSRVKVQALCPGFTYTGYHDTPEFQDDDYRARIPKFLWMRADAVVDQSLRALARGQVIFIPGFKNRLAALAGRLGIMSLMSGVVDVWFRRWRVKR
jgi:short-subunit dehydrogenase